MMKRILTIIVLAACLVGTAIAQEFTMKGDINPVKYKPGQEATVTFSHFPQTVEEFQMAQETLGQTPQGAVVLQLMAFEMWRRDAKLGKECIRLCNVESNFIASRVASRRSTATATVMPKSTS